MMNRLVIPVAALLLAACASFGDGEDERPDWLDGSSATYPSRGFLVGIGSADDLSTARDRARADLAKIFRVSIDAQSRDMQQFSTRDGGEDGTSSSQYVSDIQRDLNVQTRQVLEGVTVPESWRDPASGRFHALAVLSRSQAATRLRQDIVALDGAATTMMQRARVAADDFTRAQLALDVVGNQRQRAALQDMLRAVDASGAGVPPRWSLAALEADLDTALSRITLHAEGENGWRELLAGQLSDSGFTVSDSGRYTARLAVDETATRRDGWHWMRGVAVLDVTGADGRSLGQHRWEIKASATDASTAKLRFKEQVAERIGSEGRTAILSIVRD